MKMRIIGPILLLAVVDSMLAAQPAFAQVPCGPTITPARTLSVNWPQFRFDAKHSGCNPYEFILSPDTVGNLILGWTYVTGNSITSSPAVANGAVYVGSSDNNLYALNAGTGALLWKYPKPAGLFDSSPAVDNGVLYFGAADGYMYALNAATGALLWKWKDKNFWGSLIESSPAVANGVVCFASYNGALYALNAATGEPLWKYQTGAQQTSSSPAIANGVVYFGAGYPDYSLSALNANTGALLWKVQAGASDYSSPTVANGVVYLGGDGYLSAFNASTGAFLWLAAGGMSPAVANGVVYSADTDVGNCMYALNGRSGDLLWQYCIFNEHNGFSPAVVANGVVYFGVQYPDDSLYALNAATGAFLWKYKTGASVVSSPAVANGVVYVGSYDSYLYAFHLPGH